MMGTGLVYFGQAPKSCIASCILTRPLQTFLEQMAVFVPHFLKISIFTPFLQRPYNQAFIILPMLLSTLQINLSVCCCKCEVIIMHTLALSFTQIAAFHRGVNQHILLYQDKYI